MRKSSNVHIVAAVSAFILVAGLMLLPAVSKGMAMSMTSIPELSMLLNPTSTQGMQGGGLTFAMDSAGFTQVSMQTAENLVIKGDPIHKYSLVVYETDLKLPQNVTIHAMTFNGTVPAPVTIPPAFWAPLYALIPGVFVPSIMRWLNDRRQRGHLSKHIDIIEREHPELETINKEIEKLYVDGKLSDSHYKLLKDKISEHYKADANK